VSDYETEHRKSPRQERLKEENKIKTRMPVYPTVLYMFSSNWKFLLLSGRNGEGIPTSVHL